MAINTEQLKRYIIEPTLKDFNLYSPEAVNLLLGTAAQESHMGTYIHQINGPAQGIFQMEPNTELDIWDNYLHYRPELAQQIVALMGGDTEGLIVNLAYQTIMARLHYLRVPEPLPDHRDVPAMAQYWKRYYNTPKGRGTEAEFIENYQRFIGETDV